MSLCVCLCVMRSNANIIPILSDILSESVKEKVTRIILATFRVRVAAFLYSIQYQFHVSIDNFTHIVSYSGHI